MTDRDRGDALGSSTYSPIAARYLVSKDMVYLQVLEVCGERGEGKYRVLQLCCGDRVVHRQGEEVDQVVTAMADQVRANDAICCTIDEYLRPGCFFCVAAAREPGAHVADLHLE